MRGAPLRFAAVVLCGWTAVRIAVLWPAGVTPMTPLAVPARAELWSPPVVVAPILRSPGRSVSAPRFSAGLAASVRFAAPVPNASTFFALDGGDPAPAAIGAGSRGSLLTAPPPTSTLGSPRPIERRIEPTSRFAADMWLVLRPAGGDSLAFGQLGASQGGARLTYALDGDRRVALSARFSTPVRAPGQEAGLGIDVRPTRLPIHLLVEERLALHGGGARPAAGVIGGGSIALPAHIRLDLYGQGGAVWRRGGFADGAAIFTRPVLERGAARVEVGGGVWGAAQRGVARVDLGPSAALIMPFGGRTARLQFDYRIRLAGNARPGSGPALTLGGSF